MKTLPSFLLALVVACPLVVLADEQNVTPPTVPVRGLGGTVLQQGQWFYATVQPRDWEAVLEATASPLLGDVDLYVRRGQRPTLTEFDYADTGPTGVEEVRVTNDSSPPLTSEVWHIGVYARTPASFRLARGARQVRSNRLGNGATPYPSGVTFRVWAPFANSAHIAGQFNGWNNSSSPLVSEGGGWYSVDYRNARPGQQYKFVLRNGANVIWKNDPWARVLTTSVGNSIVHDGSAYQWQTSNFQTPAWNEMIVYQMHMGTFNDTAGGRPGTFALAEARLDYLQQMGVNVIQLLPVQEFPGDFSWGYNPSHQFAVETAYGSPDAFKSFVDKANARGIAVLMDLVHNHYGPGDLDLWRFDGWFQGSYGGVFFYNDDRAITPWGNTRPDFGRPEVRQYIVDNQRMWAEEYRVSGFRWDSTLNIRRTNRGDNGDGWSLLQWLNNDLDARQPWKINIAEDLQGDSWITRATTLGGAGFDAQWSGFVHAVRRQMNSPSDTGRDMNDLAWAITERFNGDAFERVIYTESHDENANGRQRPPSEIDSANPASYWAQKRSTLGAALVFTSPGIPKLFQGQEILEDGWFQDTDPVDWTKLTTFSGINRLYKDLIALRRNLDGRSRGLTGQNLNLFLVNNADKVIAFHRWQDGGSGDDVIVVQNWRNQTYTNYRVGLPRGGGWTVALNSDWNGYSPLFGNQFSPNFQADAQAWNGLPFSGTVNLAPYSTLILTKD